MQQPLFRLLFPQQTAFRLLGTSVTDYGTALDISDWNGVTGKNVSGTTDLAPLDQQAKCIKELFPDAKNIGIIYCSSEPNSIYQSTTITKYLEDEGYKIKEVHLRRFQ